MSWGGVEVAALAGSEVLHEGAQFISGRARLSEVTRYIAVPARYRLFEEGGTADRLWLIEAR